MRRLHLFFIAIILMVSVVGAVSYYGGVGFFVENINFNGSVTERTLDLEAGGDYFAGVTLPLGAYVSNASFNITGQWWSFTDPLEQIAGSISSPLDVCRNFTAVHDYIYSINLDWASGTNYAGIYGLKETAFNPAAQPYISNTCIFNKTSGEGLKGCVIKQEVVIGNDYCVYVDPVIELGSHLGGWQDGYIGNTWTEGFGTIWNDEDVGLFINNSYRIVDPSLEVGTNDGDVEWNYDGPFTPDNNINHTDITEAINGALGLGNCNCTGCTINGNDCSIPLYLRTAEKGRLFIDNLNVTYNTLFNITYNNNTIDLDENTYTITIYNSSFGNATLIFNGTLIYATNETIDDKAVWDFAFNPYDYITGQATTYNYSVDLFFDTDQSGTLGSTDIYSQTLHNIDIDDCTLYSTSFINFSIINETDKNKIYNGEADYKFDYTYNGYTKDYTNAVNNVQNFSLCLYPSFASLTTDIDMQYGAAGYDTRDYITDGLAINNVTQTILLYLLSAGASTEITIHVIDGSDTDLEGVLVEAYRYDVDTDSDILVETETTDNSGNVVLDLQTGSVYYSFKFYIGGDLELATNRFKLFATEYEYVLSKEGTSKLAEWLSLNNNINRALTYNNDTQLVLFDWDYPADLSLVSQICMNVTGNGSTWNSNCSSAIDSSFQYTLESHNITYTATAYVYTDTGNGFVLDVLGIDLRTTAKIFGRDVGVVLALLILLSISLIGLVNKNVAIVSSLLGLIIVYLFGLISFSLAVLVGIISLGVIVLFVINKRAEV